MENIMLGDYVITIDGYKAVVLWRKFNMIEIGITFDNSFRWVSVESVTRM